MSQGCRCPEVKMTKGWLPFCEARDDTMPDLRSPEPLGWRCPDCKRGILRIGVQESDELPDGFRIDFSCSSRACGWHEYVLTDPDEGLLSAGERDHSGP